MSGLEHSIINHKDHVLLDIPLLHLPAELLRKNFRAAHFTIEKDSAALRTLLKDAGNAAVSGRASPEEALRSIDAMIARMRGVKRKLQAHAEEEAKLHDQVDARIRHLDQLYAFTTVEDVKYEVWNRCRLDRLLADYLLRQGYTESAKELVGERSIEDLVDIDTFVAMKRIKESILNKSVTEALAWCNDNKKGLRKTENKLEFMLRYQQYIELVRIQDPARLSEAIAYARKHLSPYRETYPKEMQRAAGLLAAPHSTRAGHAAYSDLYDDARWHDLSDLFTETYYNLLALPSAPLLHLALEPGLSALKTPACHTSSPAAGKLPGNHGVCPICSAELNALARNVPYAHHTKSHVESDLMMLPNGRVYSRARLEEQARKAGAGAEGNVKDHHTGEVFGVDELKKVFIT